MPESQCRDTDWAIALLMTEASSAALDSVFPGAAPLRPMPSGSPPITRMVGEAEAFDGVGLGDTCSCISSVKDSWLPI